MPWIKRNEKFILIAILVILFFMTRLPGLLTDGINPDGVNWHYRSEQFVVGLKTFQLEKTYQHYHPGVTLMWLMGTSVELLKQLSPADEIYTRYNFLVFDFVSKYSVIVTQLILTVISLYLLSRIFSFSKAFLIVLLFTLEPFFIGNSRLVHLDILLTLLLFNGLLLSYLTTQRLNLHTALLAGFFLSTAFLTKSIAIGAFLFAFSALIYQSIVQREYKKYFLHALFLMCAFGVFTFIFFPALWKAPVSTMVNIFDEGERVGIRKGHSQIFFGEESLDPGLTFYFVVLLMKISSVILIGNLSYFAGKLKNLRSALKIENVRNILLSPYAYLVVFYVGYFAVMLLPTKKLDRYMLPLFPFLAVLAVEGYESLLKLLDTRARKVAKLIIIALVSLFIIYPAYSYYPYYFTYTNPLFGGAEKANYVIGQKPFGVAIPELKQLILKKYGHYPRLGFIDTKPMKAIYMNSRIFDVRVNGTNDYDILVLGINESMPGEVLESDVEFKLDEVLRVNGLDYWRIYAKQP